MKKFSKTLWSWFTKTKLGQWYTKPRSKTLSFTQIIGAFFLLLVYVPYVGLIVHLFAIAMGAMGVLNLTREKDNTIG